MRRFSYILLLFGIWLFPYFCSASAPELKAKDVQRKVHEFLQNHITQKKLTPEIMQRAIHNFIEQLDPLKTYFCEEDIAQWLDLSPDAPMLALESFKKNEFQPFEQIYQKMLSCIERRSSIEEEIEKMDLLENANSKELETKVWCENPVQLKEKLHLIRSLQAKYSQKLEEDFKTKFFILVKKSRKFREKEITGEEASEQEAILYSFLLKSIASALDSQTDYYPPHEAKLIMQQIQQRMVGIGVRLIDDITGFKIVDLVDGGPAKTQGQLKVNDQIIAVDNEPVVGLDIHNAVQKIQGQENSKVLLTVLRESDTSEETETLKIEVVRGNIVIEETRLEAAIEPFADGAIAHITLHGFYQDPNSSSAEDIYNKISELKSKHNLKGIILDLRNNNGGLLVQGVAISSFFIGKGIVASTKQYDGTILHFRNEQPNIVWDGPLLVLINKASASSAEIVAQCLQDYGRALIVGDTQSFGKGTYQITTILPHHFKINPKGEYKITQGMYYTVSGRTPQLKGVASDIVVPGYLSEEELGEKYAKNPVPNNSIEANYDDKLKDVQPWYQNYYKQNYLGNLQPKLSKFLKHLPTLKENSENRQKNNPDYQHFIKVLKEKPEDEPIARNDLQLMESLNIMKDLIYLYEKEEAQLLFNEKEVKLPDAEHVGS